MSVREFSTGVSDCSGLLQAAIGYIQYFNDVPALLVGVHVAGATAVMFATTQLFLDTERVAVTAESARQPEMTRHV